ncbi:DMT family transporter [Bacillus cereus group sp. RP37]|uniref:EamA family transporter n=1 Tax=Bacillus cereus group sp. RP37 TaxID=3040259 RepID=UPI00226DD97C
MRTQKTPKGAFLRWYGGMTLGGIAKVGQLQYLQPFLMIIFSVLFLGESITWLTIVLAFIVVICVIVGKSEPSAKKESYYEKHVLHK